MMFMRDIGQGKAPKGKGVVNIYAIQEYLIAQSL